MVPSQVLWCKVSPAVNCKLCERKHKRKDDKRTFPTLSVSAGRYIYCKPKWKNVNLFEEVLGFYPSVYFTALSVMSLAPRCYF